jgi:cytochrome c peroxidase
MHEYPTQDSGRFAVTGEEADRHIFKVPSLRNVKETGPYLHDGSISALEEMVRLMGHHQVGRTLSDGEIAKIVAFLGSLTGVIDPDYIEMPPMPASGPKTPPPDPT